MFGLFKKYCQSCGREVDDNRNLVRFGKHFCSEEHANQYAEEQRKLEDLDRQIMALNKLPKTKNRGGCGG